MKEENKIKNYENGFLIRFIGFLICCLQCISLVEGVKYLYVKAAKKCNSSKGEIELKNIGIDIFIVVKWSYLILAIAFKWGGCFNLIAISYLLFFNLFTYFYYHIWDAEALIGKDFKVNRVRRRFFNVLMAIAFSHLGFAYLYNVQYPLDLTNNATNQFTHWFWYSASNAVAANYDAIKPLTCWGYHISMIQLLVSFVFLTLILSKSLPDAVEDIKV